MYHCQKKDAIALIRIKSVNSTNTKIGGKLVKLFKGDRNWLTKDWYGNIYFKNASGWFQSVFNKDEEALILLSKVNTSLVVSGREDKLTVDLKNNLALSLYRDKKIYWNGFTSWDKDNFLAIKWDDIYKFLTNISN
jgi:hypothetical protein